MSRPLIAVLATSPSLEPLAQHLSGQLEAPLLPTGSDVATLDCCALVLLCSSMGLQVQQVGAKAPGPVWVDFVSGAVAHRRKFGGGAGQQIAKAVGVRPGIRPRIADVTAGLGRDAFVLATLGCSVTLVERSPIVALLLADGLARGLQDAETADIVARMTLCRADAIAWLAEQQGDQRPEVVYLDPMFPHSKKSAQVKKEMLLFRQLVGPDEDTALLLQQALAAATHRVVVKRPRIAPAIDGPPPSYSLEGKSGRFDIYALKRL